MSTLALAGISIRRLARDRTAAFFMIVLPVLIIIVIGATVGGFDKFRVGVVDHASGPLAVDLQTRLDGARSLAVTHYASESQMRTALRRSEITAGVVIPTDLDAQLRTGHDVQIPVLAEQANQASQGASAAIASVISEHASTVQAARFTVSVAGGSLDVAVDQARALDTASEHVSVATRIVDAKSNFLPNGFSYSAPTMLVLFVFINSVAFGAWAIDTRQLGVHDRALAAPVQPRAIVLGEALAALSVAVIQSVLIVAIGAAVFGVSWGNPLAAAVLVVMWALVGTGAGMLSGTLFRTPQQASSIGSVAGIALGMLGGCMWPLEIVGSAMRFVGHLTPHAWAVDAWTELLSRGGTITDIGRQLGVLAAFAAGLLVLAVVRMRRVLVA